MLNLVYPPRCACCDADVPAADGGTMLCTDCRQSLGLELWIGCRRCGAATSAAPPPDRCQRCKDFSLHFDTVSPLGEYDGKLREAVLHMKRASREALSLAIGRLLAQRRGEQLAQFRPNVVVPVPMHWWRRLRRGANSPEILAECLGHRLKLPVARLLIRGRHTRPQKDLPPRERFANVRGAFHVRGAIGTRWKGSHVLLVDDILTTGATCSEAARVLKLAGAAAVAVAVVARA
jgi:ComF family protein